MLDDSNSIWYIKYRSPGLIYDKDKYSHIYMSHFLPDLSIDEFNKKFNWPKRNWASEKGFPIGEIRGLYYYDGYLEPIDYHHYSVNLGYVYEIEEINTDVGIMSYDI